MRDCVWWALFGGWFAGRMPAVPGGFGRWDCCFPVARCVRGRINTVVDDCRLLLHLGAGVWSGMRSVMLIGYAGRTPLCGRVLIGSSGQWCFG